MDNDSQHASTSSKNMKMGFVSAGNMNIDDVEQGDKNDNVKQTKFTFNKVRPYAMASDSPRQLAKVGEPIFL